MLKLQISQCCRLIIFFRSVGDLSGSKYDKWFLIEPEHFWVLASNINLFQLAFFDTCLTREACGAISLCQVGIEVQVSCCLCCLLLLPSRVRSYGSLPDLIYRCVLLKVLTLPDLLWDTPVGTGWVLALQSDGGGSPCLPLLTPVVSIDTMGGGSHYQPVRMKVLIPYLLLHYHSGSLGMTHSFMRVDV